MTWIERTAYPQFKRLTSARVLHVFFTPSSEEVAWAEQRTGSPESCFALVLALKCFQKMARFPSPDEIPEVMIDHVRRCLELAEDVWPDHGSSPSAKAHRKLVCQRQGVKYDAGRARAIATIFATILQRVRKRAVQSIAEISDGTATAQLQEALTSPDIVVRRYAALALGPVA